MQLAQVIGHVVVTRKEDALTGVTLLLVQPLAADARTAVGRPLVAADSLGAGPGEVVFFVRGREASFPFIPAEVPVDAAVVGIVDACDYTPTPVSDPPLTS